MPVLEQRAVSNLVSSPAIAESAGAEVRTSSAKGKRETNENCISRKKFSAETNKVH